MEVKPGKQILIWSIEEKNSIFNDRFTWPGVFKGSPDKIKHMKYTTCFLFITFFCAVVFNSYAACPTSDPNQPCKPKTIDTTGKKATVKINPASTPAPVPAKPTAKKEEKKNSGDFVSPFSWRPTFLY